MKIKKALISLLLLQFVTASLFAGVYGGVLSGAKNLKLVKTQWFDIIFPDGSEAAARILYEKADSVYGEVAALYGIEPCFRMPVVLTPSVEGMNAYWTNSPYNHIVIYDTGIIEELAVFSESLISTFRHELTHAVTYNLKSPFFKFFEIFADAAVLDFDTITNGLSEGATLTSESSFGEGRLNDGFSLQMVRQAKIENQFPKYADVQGASEAYPAGAFYYFNGSFDQWLQEAYGQQKYAQFWYSCVNHKGLTTGSIFKKIYGIKINAAWKAFYEALEVPKIAANPVKAGLAKDFFKEANTDYSAKNNSGSIYSCLSVSEKGITFCDEACNSVYFTDFNGKTKKLFYQTGLISAVQSLDGSYIAVNYYDYNASAIKKRYKIYSTQTGRFEAVNQTGLQYGAIVQDEDDYYLIANKFYGQKNGIAAVKIGAKKNNTAAADSVSASANATAPAGLLICDFELNTIPLGICSVGNGRFCFVKKQGLVYSICTSSLSQNDIIEYKLPYEDMAVKNLSYNKETDEVLFSWALKNTLPRLGKLNLTTGEIFLQQKDISGGITYPVAIPSQAIKTEEAVVTAEKAEAGNFAGQTKKDIASDSIIWAGKFFKQSRLLCGVMETTNATAAVNITPVEPSATVTTNAATVNTSDFSPEPFKGIHNYGQIIIPYSSLTSTTYGDTIVSYSLPVGFTLMSGLPWEDADFTLAAGYGWKTNSVGLDFQISGGSQTSVFQYSTELSSEFDANGWKQSAGYLGVSTTFGLGRNAFMGFSNRFTIAYGKQNSLTSYGSSVFGSYAPVDNTLYFYGRNMVSAAFSNIHATGAGLYQKGGIYVAAGLITKLSGPVLTDGLKLNLIDDIAFTVEIDCPRLIPVNCRKNYVYNLPFTVSLNFLTSDYEYNSLITGLPYYSGGSAAVESVLFAKSFEKAVGFLPALFINDFNIKLCFKGGFNLDSQLLKQNWKILYLQKLINGEIPYSCYPSLRFDLGFTPNIGQLANSSFRSDLYAQLFILLKPDTTGTLFFDIGFTTSF